MRHSKLSFLFLATLSVSLLSCSDKPSPTGNSPLAATASSASGGLRTSSLAADPRSNLSGEDFDCSHLKEWFVRFSAPGFQNFNHVGVFFNYMGAPPGRKKLQIFWDEENEPGKSSYVHLGTGEADRHNDDLFDLSGVDEHIYKNISKPTTKKVRVNLIVEGMSGNCATVRRVTVTPPGDNPPELPRFVLQSITRPGVAADSILTTDVPNNRFTLAFASVEDLNCMVYTFRVSDSSLRAVTAVLGNGPATGGFFNVWGNGNTGVDFGKVAGPVMMTSITSNTDNLFRAFFSESNVHHFLDRDATASGAVTITLSAPGVQPLIITGVFAP